MIVVIAIVVIAIRDKKRIFILPCNFAHYLHRQSLRDWAGLLLALFAHGHGCALLLKWGYRTGRVIGCLLPTEWEISASAV
jgi:hypothetical protein